MAHRLFARVAFSSSRGCYLLVFRRLFLRVFRALVVVVTRTRAFLAMAWRCRCRAEAGTGAAKVFASPFRLPAGPGQSHAKAIWTDAAKMITCLRRGFAREVCVAALVFPAPVAFEGFPPERRDVRTPFAFASRR